MTKLFAALLLFSICSLARADLEIKGIEVDKPANCAHIAGLEQRKGTFLDSCNAKRKSWFTRISFLDGQTDMWVTQSLDGIVLTVALSGFDFDLAFTSLTSKFGKPEILNSTIQNRMGAKFDQIDATWRDGEKLLQLSKHGTEIGKSFLVLKGSESTKEFKDKTKPSNNL